MRAMCSASPAGFFSWPPGDSPLSPAQVKLLTRILLWTGFTGAVLLILVEGIMWVFFPAPKRISQEFEFENQLPGLKGKASFTLDERFLRTWKPDDASTGKEIHIVCLGGMATSAVLQNAPDTWWGRLASELQRQYPKSAFRVSALSVEAGASSTEPDGRNNICRPSSPRLSSQCTASMTSCFSRETMFTTRRRWTRSPSKAAAADP